MQNDRPPPKQVRLFLEYKGKIIQTASLYFFSSLIEIQIGKWNRLYALKRHDHRIYYKDGLKTVDVNYEFKTIAKMIV